MQRYQYHEIKPQIHVKVIMSKLIVGTVKKITSSVDIKRVHFMKCAFELKTPYGYTTTNNIETF